MDDEFPRPSGPAPAMTPVLAGLIGRLRAQPSRTGSVVITVFGDAIAPRGGSVWIGTLIEILRPLDPAGGPGDSIVRMAASRLAREGWLERERIGRNSFYRLGARGRAEFAAASARIYAAPAAPEAAGIAGRLRLAVLDGEDREARRVALEARGYAALAPGVLIAPDTAAPPGEGALLLRAEADDATMHALAARAWPLGQVAEGYRRFLSWFAPMRHGPALRGPEALLARVLLIHEFRRVVLRDPLLPAALLPPDWPGHAARGLCAALYVALRGPSEAWLDAHAIGAAGPLPPPGPEFTARFAASSGTAPASPA